MWRLQAGSGEEAMGELMARWRLPIFRLCARMTGDAHRAEDLTQEAFARVFARRADFRPDATFSTWLWRIALNLCRDEWRRRQTRGMEADPAALESEPSETPGPDATATAAEEGELLRRAMLRLPEAERSALLLRICEDLTFREVAEILDLPESTARLRVADGLDRLAKLLGPQIDRRPSQISTKGNTL
jgi:RNA polymerase sigma-70 factor (ECF subfamily)